MVESDDSSLIERVRHGDVQPRLAVILYSNAAIESANTPAVATDGNRSVKADIGKNIADSFDSTMRSA